MRFFSYIADALRTIMSNKMRSGLSMLGIIIGVMSVVILMAFGKGAQNGMLEQMSDIMKNTIMISPGGGYSKWSEDSENGGTQYIKKITFDMDLVHYIEEYFPSLSGKIQYVSSLDGNGSMQYDGITVYGSIVGVPGNYYKLAELELDKGSRLTKKNEENQSLVGVVSYGFMNALTMYAGMNNKKIDLDKIIGSKIFVGGKEISIIGTLKQISSDYSSYVYVPISTIQERFNHSHDITSLTIYLDPQEDNELWQKRITFLLMKKFNIETKYEAGFTVFSFQQYKEQIDSEMAIMNYLLLVIGGISLLVGGIGVMNIMLVSVTERTREIGIRKSIGALNRDIIAQFLIESVIIVLMGGFIALILSYGIVFLVNNFFSSVLNFTVTITIEVVMLALGLTTAIGIVFGILPARKAAKLKPIDALRFE